MSAPNQNPIYSRKGSTSNNGTTGMNQLILNAANDYTGANANNSVVWTADATNGGYIERLRFKAGGSNIATVVRIYINNGSVATSAANNQFYGEVTLPATTASATQATAEIDYPMGFAIDPGFRIVVGLATAVSAGWCVNGVGGAY